MYKINKQTYLLLLVPAVLFFSGFDFTNAQGVLGAAGETIADLFRFLFTFISLAFATILVSAANLLEIVIGKTILEFKDFLYNYPIFNELWRILRDLANVAITSSLIYIGLKTIYGVEEFKTKETFVKLIAVALFINFSAFFTRIIADISNNVSVLFYNQTVGTTNISIIILQIFGISNTAGQVPSLEDIFTLGVYTIFESISFLIIALMLMYVTIFVAINSFGLLFLIATSPVGFFAFLPIKYLQTIGKMWFKYLKICSTSLPLIFLMLFVITQIGLAIPVSPEDFSVAEDYAVVFGLLFKTIMIGSLFYIAKKIIEGLLKEVYFIGGKTIGEGTGEVAKQTTIRVLRKVPFVGKFIRKKKDAYENKKNKIFGRLKNNTHSPEDISFLERDRQNSRVSDRQEEKLERKSQIEKPTRTSIDSSQKIPPTAKEIEEEKPTSTSIGSSQKIPPTAKEIEEDFTKKYSEAMDKEEDEDLIKKFNEAMDNEENE